MQPDGESNAYAIYGAIWVKYLMLGGALGGLGYPISDESNLPSSLISGAECRYNKFQNGFAHIFAGGYAAGYYSYKWAEVLSADAFYSVVDEGIFDSHTADKYRQIVLACGGSQSMSILFKELMGRDADTNQLLRLNGISA